ncbi:hypothetical protein [Halanaerobium praevalens]|uniref:Uncharacterized protein n=1 Tax=Halanaerobium praevalens (strain ATCC 33744 / DSM 2228 / GSL) TaxID=572479 RepID=E3DN93_HALPG|nr:hypothetical protein [Halanaerobium praevalens]ADO77512.1 hypothetical protein Hprae_1382 [Halanaerobium praevalens DSM 2228]
MKKPYIANYIKEKNFNKTKRFAYNKKEQVSFIDERKVIKEYFSSSTRLTKSVENEDEDEFKCFETTALTENVENDDEDEFKCLESTLYSETIENDDEDEVSLFFGTKKTAKIETSDPDELNI